MAIAKKSKEQKYTYQDYLSWPEDKRVELIDGEPIAMSPSPSREHQSILGALFNKFYNYLDGRECKVYSAPLDVRLPEGNQDYDDIETIVQPDIFIVCDEDKLDDKGCIGAPDLIVEIASPTSMQIDYIRKLNLYWKHKIKEYWIIDPKDKSVMIYRLTESEEYGKPKIYSNNEEVKVGIFNELIIKLKDIFII